MNAGSSTANAADVTSTNGSWDITADTFIATAATPFSAVTTNDWVSIYGDGVTTGAVYVAQVVSVNSGGLSITLSTTAKYGTKPSASATGRSAKVNGAWASELPLAAGGLASTTVPASTKINIKQATYTIVASRTISMAGTTTAPLWFSGYNTTPGDLDNDTTNTLSKPVFAFNSTFLLTTSGTYQTWSGLSITGSRTGSIWAPSGTNQKVVRCRSENTSSNAAATACTPGAVFFFYCWFKVPTTATHAIVPTNSSRMFGCVVENSDYFDNGAGTGPLVQTVFLNSSGNGITVLGTSTSFLVGCTVYNCTGDGVKWTATPGGQGYIVGCLFSNCGGWGINNASGANTNLIARISNDFYSCTSGNETGFGDSPAFFGQTESSQVVTSSTDMTPVPGSNARRNGFPIKFENQAFGSFQNVGAVQQNDPLSTALV